MRLLIQEKSLLFKKKWERKLSVPDIGSEFKSMPKDKNQTKIEFDNSILNGTWSKPLNHIHPQNIINCPPEQNQKNIRETGRWKWRILFVVLLITSEAWNKSSWWSKSLHEYTLTACCTYACIHIYLFRLDFPY